MTPTERECRFEWIEAAIRWHNRQIAEHIAARTEFERSHDALCGRKSVVSLWDEHGFAGLRRAS